MKCETQQPPISEPIHNSFFSDQTGCPLAGVRVPKKLQMVVSQKKMNIEHRTLNVQHRIMNSVNLKTKPSELTIQNHLNQHTALGLIIMDKA